MENISSSSSSSPASSSSPPNFSSTPVNSTQFENSMKEKDFEGFNHLNLDEQAFQQKNISLNDSRNEFLLEKFNVIKKTLFEQDLDDYLKDKLIEFEQLLSNASLSRGDGSSMIIRDPPKDLNQNVLKKGSRSLERVTDDESSPDIDIEESKAEEDTDINTNILKLYQKLDEDTKNGASFLHLHIVNCLMTLFHVRYSTDVAQELRYLPSSSKNEISTKIAMNYVVEFFRQINEVNIQQWFDEHDMMDPRQRGSETGYNEPHASLRDEADSFSSTLSYPLYWLLSIFPFFDKSLRIEDQASDDNPANGPDSGVLYLNENLWLPLHFALAVDIYKQSTHSTEDSIATESSHIMRYIRDLKLLLEVYGQISFQEEVNPLSVCVSKPRPLIEAIECMLSYDPTCVEYEDEDGSIPFMHACASNTTIDAIDLLYQKRPESIRHRDNFDCAAIHYACFSGSIPAILYLIEKDSNLLQLVEGNGALPLHDVLQNQRYLKNIHDQAELSEYCELLETIIDRFPQAIYKRDDLGAFPLHKAAKFGNLKVFSLLHKRFPKAIFASDKEGLLPIHYYSQRKDKDRNLGVIQFILKHNPNSLVYSEEFLFKNDSESRGNWTLSSLFGGGSRKQAVPSNAQAESISGPISAPKRRSSVLRGNPKAIPLTPSTPKHLLDNNPGKPLGPSRQASLKRASIYSKYS